MSEKTSAEKISKVEKSYAVYLEEKNKLLLERIRVLTDIESQLTYKAYPAMPEVYGPEGKDNGNVFLYVEKDKLQNIAKESAQQLAVITPLLEEIRQQQTQVEASLHETRCREIGWAPKLKRP